MTDWGTFSEKYKHAQRMELDAIGATAQARERLLSESEPRRARWGRKLVIGSLATAGLAAAIWLVAVRPPRLTFAIGGEVRQGGVDDWLAAPAEAPLPLRFSDGSSVVLDPASNAVVVDLDRSGARVALETGRAHVSVVHRPGSRWRLRAGPFEIRVVGTTFDVAWSPESERFELNVQKGKVEVSGEGLLQLQSVAGGQSLKVVHRDGRWQVVDTEVSAAGRPEPPVAPPIVEPLPEPSPPAKRGAKHDAPPTRVASAQTNAPDWRRLASAGNYREAVAAAERVGLNEICRTGSAADLLALAQAARFSGRLDGARQILSAIVDRFAGDPAASVAMFTLGRVAFDSKQDDLGAAHWFAAYLRAQPNGHLAREAAGRLFEALRRGGDLAAARAAARQYLDRYPDGPHAALARELLAN